MTDQPNPTTPPASPGEPAPTGPTWAEPALPAVEPIDDGAPAQVVERATAVPGDGASPPRGSSRVRWAIALGGVAIVAAATIAVLALAGGRPTLSIAVGYMPDDTVQYGEYRLDLPGDQRQKLAAFLSKLPGFADQAAIQPKLYEVFDKLVTLVSSSSQTFTADIEPWFDGQIATGSEPFDAAALTQVNDARSPLAGMGSPLIVVTIKDQAKANAWLVKTIGTQDVSITFYGGATLYTSHGVAAAVTDKVLIGGSEAAVKAAVDTNGKGKLADDPEFKAAFASVSRDYVAFTFIDYRSAVGSVVNLGPAVTGIEKSTRDVLLGLVPAWLASDVRFEDDALVGEGTFPSIDVGYTAKNRASSLAGHAPASTLFYGETHDIGAAIKAFLGKLRAIPELTTAFSQIDQSAGLIGGVDGVTGWWGDMAIAIGPDANGQIGGGLLITPTDPAAAKKTFDTLRSFMVLGGSQAGVTLRDEKHGDATVTVVDFSGAMTASGGLPPGVKAEIAYTVTNDVVVIGYGAAYVNAVLDAGPGPSLAEDARFKGLLGRVGAENLGVTFVDVQGIRALLEPLMKAEIPADQWATYEKEYLPYIQPLDAFISSARVDGGLNRLPMAFTVK